MKQNNDRVAKLSASQWRGEFERGLPSIIAIIVLVFATWSGVLSNGFVNWDDNFLLTNNEAYRGLSLSHLHWMFTTNLAGHYQPLTWLSYAVDYSLWGGLDPVGVHLTNLLLHLATALGLYFVIVRLLTAAMPRCDKGSLVLGATFATLFFALHPLRVESVAWATERRDVLSGLWIILTLIFYLRAAQDHPKDARRSNLCLALVCYVFSLLSKATGMTLPAVLLILDIYPLRRFTRCCETPTSDRASLSSATGTGTETRNAENTSAGTSGVDGKTGGGELRRCLLEKLLFLIPASAAAVAAVWAQHQAGALRTYAEQPFALRIGQAFYGVFFYLWKTIWPAGLIPLYEQPVNAEPWDTANLFSALFFVVFTIVAWTSRKRAPALLTGWVVYIVLLLPMLGLAQSGPQVVADRYSYLACIPWAVIAGGVIAKAWCWKLAKDDPSGQCHRKSKPPSVRRGTIRSGRRYFPVWPTIFGVAGVGWLGLLAVHTEKQTLIWHDSVTLWTATIERAPHTGTAHANLASALNRLGEYEQAKRHAQLALKILPGNRTAHIALASAAVSLHDYSTAKKHFEIALRIRPADPTTLSDLIRVESIMGQLSAAVARCHELIAMEPTVGEWQATLGGLLAKDNRFPDAILAFERALHLNPRLTQARFRLASLLERSNHLEAAIEVLEQGIAMSQEEPTWLAKLAWLLATKDSTERKDKQRALALANQAIALAPNYAPGYEAKAAALARLDRFDDAEALLESALRRKSIPKTTSQRNRWLQYIDRFHKGQRLPLDDGPRKPNA